MIKSRQNFTPKKQHKTQCLYFCLYFCVAGKAVDCACRVNGMKVIYVGATRVTFQPKLKKYKKHTSKIFLVYSQKCFSFILRNGTFLYFLKMMFFLYFGKWNFLSPRLKNIRRELSKIKKQKISTLKKVLYFSKKSSCPHFEMSADWA